MLMDRHCLNISLCSLPVAAIVDEKIFCCHGGLSPDLQSMEQIRWALSYHVQSKLFQWSSCDVILGYCIIRLLPLHFLLVTALIWYNSQFITKWSWFSPKLPQWFVIVLQILWQSHYVVSFIFDHGDLLQYASCRVRDSMNTSPEYHVSNNPC